MKSETVYLIYDGECPICSYAATVIRLRESVGALEIINARKNHQLVEEAKKQGYDLDEGMVVKYQGASYYGKDAMHILAMLGSPVSLFNKINAFLFKSKILAALFYPIFKFIRRCLLLIRGVQKIQPDNSEPIFKSIFGKTWEELPVALKKHYANRPYSNDVVALDGVMDIKLSKLTRAMKPLFKVFGTLVPYEGKNIPTTVYSKSELNSGNYILERHFHFPHQKPYVFRSAFMHKKDNQVLEITKFGISWLCYYTYENENKKVLLTHKGYAWKIFGLIIPVPLTLLLGKVYAEEQVIDDNSFRMRMSINHPWFGDTFEYKGRFKIV